MDAYAPRDPADLQAFFLIVPVLGTADDSDPVTAEHYCWTNLSSDSVLPQFRFFALAYFIYRTCTILLHAFHFWTRYP